MSAAFCSCPFCQQQIEFDVENGGSVAVCPSCGRELTLPNQPTVEYEIVPRASPPPLPIVVETDLNDNSVLAIQLNSGAELRVKAIKLYDGTALAEVNAKKAKAVKLLGGISTGLGAIGSLEWVLTASVLIGAAEAALSAGAESAGSVLLKEAFAAESRIRKAGIFKPIGTIQEIEHAAPGLWHVPASKLVQFVVKIREFPIDKTEMRTKPMPFSYIHNGDEFIVAKTEDDSTCSIRWSAVERYEKKNGAA